MRQRIFSLSTSRMITRELPSQAYHRSVRDFSLPCLVLRLALLSTVYGLTHHRARRVVPQLIFLVDGFKAIACLGEERTRTSIKAIQELYALNTPKLYLGFPLSYLTIELRFSLLLFTSVRLTERHLIQPLEYSGGFICLSSIYLPVQSHQQ